MPDGLYEVDILDWSERQAALLRRIAAGELVNELVDWPNLIEEVEALGRTELRSCRSLLRQALLHLCKLHGWPGNPAAGHWRVETAGFLVNARDAFSPSMQQRISLDDLYADTLDTLRHREDDTGEPRPWPKVCPFALNDLLARHPDIAGLIAQLDVDQPKR